MTRYTLAPLNRASRSNPGLRPHEAMTIHDESVISSAPTTAKSKAARKRLMIRIRRQMIADGRLHAPLTEVLS